MAVQKTYLNLNANDSDTEEDANGPADLNGYLGDPRRRFIKNKLHHIDEKDIILLFTTDLTRFLKIFKLIRTIDRDHNGYVTITELEDIIKIIYAKELSDKDIVTYLKQFRSIQNKILVDYKQFKSSVLKQVTRKKEISLSPYEDITKNNQ